MNQPDVRRVAIGAVLSVVCLLSSVSAPLAAHVTGAGQKEGFSFAGMLIPNADGGAAGFFEIIVHPTFVDANVVSVICRYRTFDSVVINAGTATFHSRGTCRALNADGTVVTTTSDNTFGIIDGGEPGAGADNIDVNFLGAGGVSIPGGLLEDGNFVVDDTTEN